MTTRRKTKFIHESRYVAEVEIDVIEDETSWSPYLSLEDAKRLDQVREALRSGDVKTAAQFGRVYTLNPVAVV
ncbi:MAG: hypothetical protein K2Y31_17155 [Burkholderiales bacterium]|nr:hypothetical protein [Burkholderiales bacterium]